MLAYLVSSKTKLNLLNLLWKYQMKASASDLAKMAKLSFPSVHAELQNMEHLDFVKSELVGNSRHYFANREFKFAKVLSDLLNVEQTENLSPPTTADVSTEDVLLNMSSYGAPLGTSGKPNVNLSLEETVAFALKVARKNPTVARAIPVLLYTNKDSLDLEKVKFFAERLKEKHSLGFFLDLTATLAPHRKYHQFSKELFDKRVKKAKNFFLTSQGKYGQQLTEQNTPPVARKWKYLMNMELDTFRTLFDKFIDVSA